MGLRSAVLEEKALRTVSFCAAATWSLLFSKEEGLTSKDCACDGGLGSGSAPLQNPLTPERRNYLLANAQVGVAAVGAGAFP